MRIFLLALISVLVFTGFSSADAAEGRVVECGAPVTGDIDTDIGLDVCDIYTRQLEYRVERMKLSKQLRERQKHFVAPYNEAKKRYNEQLDALNAGRGEYTE